MEVSVSDHIAITGWARTPIAAPMGALQRLTAVTLGAAALSAAAQKAGCSVGDLAWVRTGCLLTGGLGPNPTRAVATAAGAGDVAAANLQAGRAAGLAAVAEAFLEIQSERWDTTAAGGFASVSNSPLLIPKGRAGSRLGGSPLWDPAVHDAACSAEGSGTPDRELADRSIELAALHSAGSHICTVEVPDRKKGPQPLSTDTPLGDTADPAGARAADGAAMVVLQRGGSGPRVVAALPHPADTLGPVGVLNALLDRTGWNANDLACLWVSEDSAAEARTVINAAGLPLDRANPWGGGIGRGAPPGAGGVIELVHACALLGTNGGGKALVIAGSGPDDAAGLALEL
jgi:acetyl-CoA C-acetyltransferase